jgi:hypothetical protein
MRNEYCWTGFGPDPDRMPLIRGSATGIGLMLKKVAAVSLPPIRAARDGGKDTAATKDDHS